VRSSLAITALGLGLAFAAGCRGDDDADAGDARAADARLVDAPVIDAPAIDAPPPDAAFACEPFALTPAEACAVALTGAIEPCSLDGNGAPSQNGRLRVRRPDGAVGYLCAAVFTVDGGYYFDGDRFELVDDPTACCGGPPAPALPWPAADPAFGVPHGPDHVKPWETPASAGGDLLHNPFSVIVSSPAEAAMFAAKRQQWLAWSGDGQPHPAPGGGGSYWFEPGIAINYVLVPTADGRPLIVIGPEVSRDAGYVTQQGHPTLGVCTERGGAPMAFIGGDLRGTVLSNRSGRFGRSVGVTRAQLEAAARLFNCYGITITSVNFLSN
jgi:hypothetical protein